MSFPRIGMTYEQVKKKLMGPLGKNFRTRDSLLNQCRLAEGESATKELERESAFSEKGSAFSGAGSKQIGCCMRFDCLNRDKKCGLCYRWSNYIQVLREPIETLAKSSA
jgi:hypothetical protein